MAEANFARMPDGAVLRTLESGLQIVRRKKHEWRDALASMTLEKLRMSTNKVHGSKFLPAWDLTRLVAWIEVQARAANWTGELQEPNPIVVRLGEIVGIAGGERVHTIRVVCDGRYIHAYPVKD
jgi:hypothetical protein